MKPALLLILVGFAASRSEMLLHGNRQSGRLAIRNVLVVQGNGTPAEGRYEEATLVYTPKNRRNSAAVSAGDSSAR